MNSVLEIKNISKSFASNTVLSNVSIKFNQGEIHSIVGENGAGKSTLMKIIGGIYTYDSGEIYIDGEKVDINNTRDAFDHGISIVHQELSVTDNLTVAQNVFVNREPTKKFGLIDWEKLNKMTVEQFEMIGIKIDPKAKVSSLSVGMKQIVEIVKALSQDVRILIMDEPTSSLSDNETKKLFELITKLKEKGTLIIFISHKLNEICSLSDRVSVLRDGHLVGTLDKDEIDIPTIIRMMVGRNLDNLYPPKSKGNFEQEVLKLENVSRAGKFENVNLSLNRGEIIGLFGLVGSGRTELAHSIFGVDKIDQGKIYLNGEFIIPKTPAEAIELGIAYLSEDRKDLGLFVGMSVKDNVVVTCLDKVVSKYGILQEDKISKITEDYIENLGIVPKDENKIVYNLSGGNQQKVLFAKWLASKPTILIVDEPTKGVDIGAKAKIHFLLRDLAEQGVAILMISSELPEIIGLSDKVAVMHEGKVKRILENENLDEETIMAQVFEERDEI